MRMYFDPAPLLSESVPRDKITESKCVRMLMAALFCSEKNI